MDVRVVSDLTEFEAGAGALYAADPIRNTIPLTALGMAGRSGRRPVLLTVHDGPELVGAVLRTPPYPFILNELPAAAVDAAVTALRDVDPDAPGVVGPREVAEAFADTWTAHTGASWKVARETRLYRLGDLTPPDTTGTARVATADDLAVLVPWLDAFRRETHGPEDVDPVEHLRLAHAGGDGSVLWELDGVPVSWAKATAPRHGMSRVAPVYTPPEHRGHGYGSAVTAAASRWALDQGVTAVLLFTDLANPTTNSIYQKIGYRPVLDTVELAFTTP
jgi:predicted GNAT family acetyltransferase